MADRNSYPQIPSTVWWGVRAILQRTPGATIDDRMLSVTLGVQEAAARQYSAELRRVGILNDENKATPLAQRWRLDESYLEATDEIVSGTYPEGLLHVAPPGQADRQKIISWFLREGLGQGAATNKASTYLLIGSREPSDGRGAASAKPAQNGARTLPARKPPSSRSSTTSEASSLSRSPKSDSGRQNAPRDRPETIPLNVNVQIHISADAGSEQIESIFSAMRRYLYDAPAD